MRAANEATGPNAHGLDQAQIRINKRAHIGPVFQFSVWQISQFTLSPFWIKRIPPIGEVMSLHALSLSKNQTLIHKPVKGENGLALCVRLCPQI